MITIVLKKDFCTSCGVCWHEMCDVFGRDADNLALLLKTSLDDARKAELERVADICPGECIEFTRN
jgi:ferredoxin